MARPKTEKRGNGGANLGFEQTLWQAADKLRGHMDAAEYKHVVLGLIFLKYISDAFEEQHAKLAKEKGADPEDRDEYVAVNIFWVPPEARWTYLQGRAKDPLIGKLLDNAMVAIERDNPSLKGVLPKNYARPDLNKQQLGEVIDLIGSISFRPSPSVPLPAGEGSNYRGGYKFAGLVERARELRKKQTSAEEILWEMLRDRRFLNLKFRRQHQIGDYIVDFCCAEAKLVVETHGPIHEREAKKRHDHGRDAYLEALGYRVRRFKNEQVETNPQSVLEEIKRTVEEIPSHSGRGAGGEGHSQTDTGQQGTRSMDVLGRVYEYFLNQFASAEGKKGGQFYTPRCVVQLLVEMLAPYKGRVFDPCCDSGGMFVQSVRFVEAHAKGNGDGDPTSPRLRRVNISIFGQESNPTTWKLAKMNLAIRGIEADLGDENADSFHRDLHKDLKADYILANPPFNMSDWGGDRLRDDPRWKYGAPPVGNANFAWVQHFIHHLAPTGLAGFVLANDSMSSNSSGEGDIRKAIIEADLVDCMVALPGKAGDSSCECTMTLI
ncbi:MAG TPA: N-6 DNA methylase [Verrucomicrobiae bacterium]|nr:N-6 DNA methylase [Verrucomicrobiae bacterium]